MIRSKPQLLCARLQDELSYSESSESPGFHSFWFPAGATRGGSKSAWLNYTSPPSLPPSLLPSLLPSLPPSLPPSLHPPPSPEQFFFRSLFVLVLVNLLDLGRITVVRNPNGIAGAGRVRETLLAGILIVAAATRGVSALTAPGSAPTARVAAGAAAEVIIIPPPAEVMFCDATCGLCPPGSNRRAAAARGRRRGRAAAAAAASIARRFTACTDVLATDDEYGRPFSS